MGNKLLIMALALLILPSISFAMPSLSGPGGLITIPSAYVKTGGLVAPVTTKSGDSQSTTSLNYAFADTMELGLQKPSNDRTGINLKYQLTKDQEGAGKKPATAFGFMDQKADRTKSFYGVMSKNLQSKDSSPFILHCGIMSEGSIAGHLRPIVGFETVLTKQTRLIGEYNGSQRDVNSGVVYNITEAMGSFVYLMNIDEKGLNADVVSGFTFNVTF